MIVLMEQHPVPQNVTTFQFRLIGDMTIKQFGYLAGGAILAYVSYKLPLPFFFRWPLTVVFALGGFGFAFVPIEERPMDVWVLSFLKNVYSPTLFHWEYSPAKPETLVSPGLPTPLKTTTVRQTDFASLPKQTPKTQTQQLSGALQQLFTPKPSHQPAKQMAVPKQKTKTPLDDFFLWIDALFAPKPQQKPSPVVQEAPTPASIASMRMQQKAASQTSTPSGLSPSKQGVPMPQKPPASPEENEEKQKQANEELTMLKLQLEALQKELQTKNVVESRLLDLQKQMSEVMAQREATEKELVRLRQMSQMRMPQQPQKSAGFIGKTTNEPTVKVMGMDAALKAGLPKLTTFPNVVTGIIKDYDKNLLPGVLVTVKDKEGVPLRALKTNKLGQFAASTPLPNGTYLVEVEDPREKYLFDRVQITLNGAVMPAILIAAKSKKQLDREQLQKQIFGTPNAST